MVQTRMTAQLGMTHLNDLDVKRWAVSPRGAGFLFGGPAAQDVYLAIHICTSLLTFLLVQ